MSTKYTHVPRRVRRHFPRTTKIMLGAGTLLLTVVAAITASSTTGTLALWNDSASIPEASITVGASQAGLSIATGTQAGPEDQTTVTFPASTWTNMLPGDVIGAPITITNLDAHAYSVAAAIETSQAASSELRFALAPGSCTAGPLTGTVLSSAPTALNGQTLNGKTSKTYCLQIELSSSVAASQQGAQITPSFTLTIQGQ